METVAIFKQYLEYLFTGQRSLASEWLFDAHDRGFGAHRLLSQIIWPAMEQIDKLRREDHISRITEHLATRINRMVADQLQQVLNHKPKDGRRLVVLCGNSQIYELGAQITSDLFEAEGWSVWFIGSDVPNDEILQFLGHLTPDLLFFFRSMPSEVPQVRQLIGLIREIGICEQMRIMLCGGIYNRAQDLAEELKADLRADTIRQALCLVEENPSRVARSDTETLEPGRRRKRKRKAHLARVAELRDRLGLAKASPGESAGAVPEKIRRAVAQSVHNISPVTT
jgi:methanogenic corrinoid protein MtbC1